MAQVIINTHETEEFYEQEKDLTDNVMFVFKTQSINDNFNLCSILFWWPVCMDATRRNLVTLGKIKHIHHL